MTLASPLLDEGNEKVLSAQVKTGGRLNRLSMTEKRLEDERIQVEQLFSETCDADVAETIANFQAEQNILQATLGSSAQLLQLTLLDYL